MYVTLLYIRYIYIRLGPTGRIIQFLFGNDPLFYFYYYSLQRFALFLVRFPAKHTYLIYISDYNNNESYRISNGESRSIRIKLYNIQVSNT